MYVGLDENGGVDTRYEDTSAEMLMKSVPDVVLHKVPDELGDIGRGIYKYKMVEGAFVLKDDLSDWEEKNKRAIINSYRSHRDELLAQTDWTQTEDCPLDIHKKEMYRAYRKFLRDFPQTHDPETKTARGSMITNCPKRWRSSLWKRKSEGFPPAPYRGNPHVA
jgi:NAD-dependent dihydropyrimidine dehydrogenase PreA subunit